MDLFAELKALLVKDLSLEGDTVVPDAHLQDDLGADSLALLNLAKAIAEKYEIELEVDELLDLDTVDDLVALVRSKTATQTRRD